MTCPMICFVMRSKRLEEYSKVVTLKRKVKILLLLLSLREGFPLTSAKCCTGLECAEKIKIEFDTRWSPHWHCIVGRNFGSFVTHETKKFIFFYLGDKAVMLFKAG